MPVDFKGRVFMDILDILGFCWTQYQRTLSPPDTEKPALRGFFRIWRRERSGVGPKSTKSATTQPPVRNLGNRKCPIEQGSGSNRAKRAHETRHRRWMASPKGKRRSRAVIPLSPPDTEKPALRGFFRIWRRERSGVGPKSTKSATTQPPVRNLGNRKCPIEQGSGSNRAKRAHETRHRRWMASPKGKRRSRAVIPLSPPDTASPAFAGFVPDPAPADLRLFSPRRPPPRFLSVPECLFRGYRW